MRTTASCGTTPSIEQPKAVEHAASSGTRGCCARSHAAIRATSATCSEGARLRLARLWPSLTETGALIRCAPAACAACAPRRLGASATTVRPGISTLARTTVSVSAICGITRAGTKLPTSISGTPAAAIAAIQAILVLVAMRELAICKPSRGPTSQTVTRSPIVRSSPSRRGGTMRPANRAGKPGHPAGLTDRSA